MDWPIKKLRETTTGRLRIHFSEKEQLEDIAYAMTQMLKMPLQESRALARAGAAQRTQLNRLPQAKDPTRALHALRNMKVSLDVKETARELEAHGSASYLLALPFTVSAMSLIAQLVSDTRRRFCIVDTRYTRYYFTPFLVASETRGRVQLLSLPAMLAHHRKRLELGDETTGEAITYVTFPDLETTSLDTARRVPFMGEDYQFSTLEPLLFFRGVAPLFTFDAGEFTPTRRLKLVAYPAAAVNVVSEADVDALLAWLAGKMEQVFREVPADVLSWPETLMLSYSMKATTAVMKLKMVEGYLRAWKDADPNFQEAKFVSAIAELQKAQETLDKDRLAAISG